MEHQLAKKSTQKEQSKKPASSPTLQPKPAERDTTHPVLRLQRAVGNQAVQNMVRSGGMGLQTQPRVNTYEPEPQALVPITPSVLQRKCACGGSSESTGECAECKAEHEPTLQRSVGHQAASSAGAALTIGLGNDNYEQEAEAVSSALSVSSITQHLVGADRSGSSPDCSSIQQVQGKQKTPKKEKKPEKCEEEKEQKEEEHANELRECASEEDLAEVEDVTSTIGEKVWADDLQMRPLYFARNWEVIKSQICDPKPTPKLKIKKLGAKGQRALFPQLYDVDLVSRLADLKKKGLSQIIIHDVHKRLRYYMSFMKQLAEEQKGLQDSKSYEEEYRQFLNATKPLADSVMLDTFISMRDALVQKFLPQEPAAATPVEGPVSVAKSDFDRALPNIKKFYDNLEKAEFLAGYLKGSNTLVHKVMKEQLGKAAAFLAKYKGGEWLDKVKAALSKTPTDIQGLGIRQNVNHPENISEHAFGRAVDILPNRNPNVHREDFPEKMVRAFTGEDVYKGLNVRIARQNLLATVRSPEQILDAVTALHKASDLFKGIYEDEANFGEGLKKYLESEEKRPLKVGATELFSLVRRAYEEREQKQKEQKKGKQPAMPASYQPQPTIPASCQPTIPASFQPQPTIPASYQPAMPASYQTQYSSYDQLLFTLERNCIPAGKLNERAQFLLEAYDLFTLSHRWVLKPKELPSEGEATRYSLEEYAQISVKPEVQGTPASIAAYGFINLPDELILALTHSEGGNLYWLGAEDYTKDYMHFELKPSKASQLPGELTSGSSKETTPPVQPRGKKAEKAESPEG